MIARESAEGGEARGEGRGRRSTAAESSGERRARGPESRGGRGGARPDEVGGGGRDAESAAERRGGWWSELWRCDGVRAGYRRPLSGPSFVIAFEEYVVYTKQKIE